MIGILVCSVFLVLSSSWANASAIPYDPNTMTFLVNVQQAEAAVRAWAGDPELPLDLIELHSLADEEVPPWRYVFKTEDRMREFDVDCDTGEVVFWRDSALSSAYNAKRQSENPGPELSEQQLTLLSQQFLAQKYADFIQLNIQPASYHWFARRLPNGTWDSGFGCSVGIDTYSGDIFKYSGHRSDPLAISPDPTVAQGAAESIALGAFTDLQEIKSIFLFSNDGLWVDRDQTGLQRLVWIIHVVLSDYENYTLEQYQQETQNPDTFPRGDIHDVKVDAHTGEVIYRESGGFLGNVPNFVDRITVPLVSNHVRPVLDKTLRYPKASVTLNGVKLHANTPPLIIDGVPYLYVRHTTLLGYAVSWSNGFILMKGKSSVELQPGSHTVVVNGKQVKFAHPVRTLFDRAYVPLDCLKAILGDAVSWDAVSRMMSLKSILKPRGETPLSN